MGALADPLPDELGLLEQAESAAAIMTAVMPADKNRAP
jgi:hypothetical protein